VAAQSVHRAVVRTRVFCALTVAMARGVGAYGVAMTLVGIASYAAAQPRPPSPQDRVGVPGPRVGCDPYMMRQPEAVPAAQRATCGDGRARSGVLSCWRDCTGGCDGVSGCSEVQCLSGRELCDGRDLGGESCLSHGFTGGELRCNASCDGYDISRCRACSSSAEVACGELDVGPGVSSPVLAENGADIAVVWAAGGAAGRDIQFGRISARASIDAAVVPIGRTTGDLAMTGAPGGFLVAYRTDAGTVVTRVDRNGRVIDDPRRIAEGSTTLELVKLDALSGGTGLTLLVMTTGATTRFVYLDASGRTLDAPPRGLVLYGVGRRTRVFVVPFTRQAASGVARSALYRSEAQTGDTVVAAVTRGTMSYAILRGGQPFGGSASAGTGELDLRLGAGGVDRLIMHAEGGVYRDVFTPNAGTPIERSGPLGAARPPARGLAEHPSVRDRSYLPLSATTGVEVGLLGGLDGAGTLLVAHIHARPRPAPRGPRAPRVRSGDRR